MKLKGSYTVEAAWIISICLLVTGWVIGVSYDMFYETNEYVAGQEYEFDAAKTFRIKSTIGDIMSLF